MSDLPASKRCRKCGEEKPLEEFHRNSRGKFGRHSACKPCARARAKQWVADNPERRAATTKNWRQENPAQDAAIKRRWAQENPERHKANTTRWKQQNPDAVAAISTRTYNKNRDRAAANRRQWVSENRERKKDLDARSHAKFPEKAAARKALNQAVERGAIVKPSACEECAAPTESLDLHGHHADYSKPLEVEWLCRRCHAKRHPKTG